MTKAESAWMDAITRYGCIVCRMLGHSYVPAEPHHLLRGGRRIGHTSTIPLCPPHHRTGEGEAIARHPNKARFESAYGKEADLLTLTRNAVSY